MNPQEPPLEAIRGELIRQEETIIFALIERARFSQNRIIYEKKGIAIPDFSGSYVDYLLFGTECLHARVRRYTSPDEFPFFRSLPEPIIKSGPDENKGRYPKIINHNSKIRTVYESQIIPLICRSGDDGQYGSSAVCDVNCLQAISKRVHYGIFVARRKYHSRKKLFESLIEHQDRDRIHQEITDSKLEQKLLARVEHKATTYGQDIQGPKNEYKIKPSLIRDIYDRWLIPLTKEVQVEYLIKGFPTFLSENLPAGTPEKDSRL